MGSLRALHIGEGRRSERRVSQGKKKKETLDNCDTGALGGKKGRKQIKRNTWGKERSG